MRKHGWFRPHVRGLTAISSTTLREGGGWWLAGSQLDLDFARDRSFNRKTGYNATPNGLLTYTSPSPKMVYGDDGLLGYARHNLHTQSAFASGWTDNGATLTPNSTTAPDGTQTAALLTGVSGNFRVYQIPVVVPYTQYTLSVYVKQGTSPTLRLDFVNTANGPVFTFATKTWSSVSGFTTGYQELSGGWYRLWVSRLSGASTAGGVGLVLSGTTTAYVWGAQLSCGAVLFDYLATTSAAKYDLPIAHDPLTHAPLGVLIEEQRTNLLLRSEDCTTTWTNPIGPTTSTKVNIPSPFHDGIAFQITNTLNSGFSSGGLRQSVAVASSTQHFLSFYVEDNVGLITIALENGLSAYGASFLANVDTATGVSSGPNAAQVTTVAVNGGWHVRANLGTSKSGGGLANVEIQMTVDGLGVPKILAAIQLEAGAFATSYIQTGSAQVTRAADQVSLATSAFNFSASTGTLVVEATPVQVSASCYVAALDDGTGNELTAIRIISDRWRLLVLDNTVQQANIDIGSAQVGAEVAAAIAYAADDFAGARNGSVALTDTGGTVPTPTSLKVGYIYAGGQFNGRIKRLTYWNSRKANAELQALSA